MGQQSGGCGLSGYSTAQVAQIHQGMVITSLSSDCRGRPELVV
jgi:hypothetical protein